MTDFIDKLPNIVPAVVFKTRVRDDSIEGTNPYRWQDVTSYELFANKRVVLFAPPIVTGKQIGRAHV